MSILKYGPQTMPIVIKGFNGSISAHFNITLKEEAEPYDELGASYYIIITMIVYGLAVVMLIAYLSKKSEKAKILEHEERQVLKYLNEVPSLQESNARQQFKQLKSNIETLVDKTRPDEGEVQDALEEIINCAEGAEIVIEGNDCIPTRKISEVSTGSVLVRIPLPATPSNGYYILSEKELFTSEVDVHGSNSEHNSRKNITLPASDSKKGAPSFQPHLGHVFYYKPHHSLSHSNLHEHEQTQKAVRTTVKTLPVNVKNVQSLIQEKQYHQKIKTRVTQSSYRTIHSIAECDDEDETSSHSEVHEGYTSHRNAYSIPSVSIRYNSLDENDIDGNGDSAYLLSSRSKAQNKPTRSNLSVLSADDSQQERSNTSHNKTVYISSDYRIPSPNLPIKSKSVVRADKSKTEVPTVDYSDNLQIESAYTLPNGDVNKSNQVTRPLLPSTRSDMRTKYNSSLSMDTNTACEYCDRRNCNSRCIISEKVHMSEMDDDS